MKKIGITDHCVQKFIERSSPKSSKLIVAASVDRVRKTKTKIWEMLSKATPVQLKPGYRANNVLTNGLRHSVFMRYNDWILVLDHDMTTVVTCYPSSALRWVNIGPQTTAGRAMTSLQHDIDRSN